MEITVSVYITATESDEKPDNIKTSIFLTCIGKQGLEIYNTFVFADDGDKMKLKPVMEMFETYCKPRKNITLTRHHFFTYQQSEGQSFDAFVTELKKRSSQCEFATLQDSLIRDMIVIGVISNSLRERLLRIDNLSLEDAIKIGQAAEATKKHAYELCRSHKLRRKSNNRCAQVEPNLKSNQQKMQKQEDNEYISQPCKYCGTLHKWCKCPAYGKTFLECKKLNHFASLCLSTKKRIDLTQAHSQLQYESDSDDFFIGIIDQTEKNDNTFEENTNVSNVTPPYWQKFLYEVVAMVKQLGIPTWFMTLSCADLRWPELFQIVARTQGRDITEEQVEALSYIERCQMLNANPVVTAKHFQHRVETFFSEVLLSKSNPIGKVIYYALRIEF